MKKNCQRCQSTFNCQPENISKCACSKIHVQKDTLAYLEKTKYTCLCNTCLLTLDSLITKVNQQPCLSPSDLQEGLHYYMENNFLVFTELYHLTRGYCCGSGCRHCAYGFQKS